jgi:hypothetical protein
MTRYVRYKKDGEVRMDFQTFKRLPLHKITDPMRRTVHRPKPHGKGAVREFT